MIGVTCRVCFLLILILVFKTEGFSVEQLVPLALDALLAIIARPSRSNDNLNLPKEFNLTDDLVKSMGYEYENYTVTTEDGYNLKLHRILSPNGKYATGFPVLLQHCLLCCSETWLVQREKSLPKLLADNGYDVWISDLRGNTYSKSHVKHKVTDNKFWDFTFHEMGKYDTPAFIDKILFETRRSQLFFVGHSMGSTAYFTMASLKPEYNKKVKAAVLLAPVATGATLIELPNPILRLMLMNADLIRDTLMQRNVFEFFPRTKGMINFIDHTCGDNSGLLDFCLDAIGLILGENRQNLDRVSFLEKAVHFPAGVGALVLHHYAQIYTQQQRGFRMYDRGAKENMIAYGTPTPPLYPLKNITSPVALIYSDNDDLVNERSVTEIANELPNVIIKYKIKDPKFTHADYILGESALDLVFKKVLQILDSYSDNNL